MKLPVDEKRVEDEVRSLVHRLRSYRLLRNLLIGFILVALVNVLFTSLFYTPKMYRIVESNRDLVLKYEILQNRIRAAQHRLDEIKHRDNYVYRPLFSSDTIFIDGIYSPYDHSKYASVEGDEYAPLMMSTSWRAAYTLSPSRWMTFRCWQRTRRSSRRRSLPCGPSTAPSCETRSEPSVTACTRYTTVGNSTAEWICPDI